MHIIKAGSKVTERLTLLENYKGFDITLEIILQETYNDNVLVKREVLNIYNVWDSKTGYETFESINFHSIQDIIDYIDND